MSGRIDPLESSIEILASPSAVWAIVSDLRRMTEWSPEVIFQKFTGGTIGEGTRSINLNKRKGFIWPTSSKVTVFEPDKVISFFVHGSSAQWTYELEPVAAGTRLTERRELKGGKRSVLSKVTAAVALGGIEGHDAELLDGIHKTLSRIKVEAES